MVAGVSSRKSCPSSSRCVGCSFFAVGNFRGREKGRLFDVYGRRVNMRQAGDLERMREGCKPVRTDHNHKANAYV